MQPNALARAALIAVYCLAGSFAATCDDCFQSPPKPKIGAGAAIVPGTSPTPSTPNQNGGLASPAIPNSDVAAHLAVVFETNTLKPLEEAMSSEERRRVLAEQSRRQASIRALATSAQGCEEIVDLVRSWNGYAPWDVVNSLGLCVPVLSSHTSLRNLLEVLPSTGGFCGAEVDLRSVDPETIFQLNDVWRDWLREFKSESARRCTEFGSGESPSAETRGALGEIRMLNLACTALTITCDVDGARLLRDALTARSTEEIHGDCGTYFNAIGDRNDLERVRSIQLADEESAWATFLEDASILPFGKLQWSRHWPPGDRRSDLQRGLWNGLVNRPDVRLPLLKAHASARFSNSPLESIQFVGHSVPQQRIIEMIREAIEIEQWSLASSWLDALGRTEDPYEISMLLQLAGYQDAADGEAGSRTVINGQVRSGALRAVARQLLINPETTLDQLERLIPHEVETVLEDAATSCGPLLRLRGPRDEHLVRLSRQEIARHVSGAHLSFSATFVEWNEEALLNWLERIDDPCLGPAYALMLSQEATERLSVLIQKGDSRAIESTWALRRIVEPSDLQMALKIDRLSGWDRTMVQLMLAEQGSDDAYRVLTRQLEAVPPFPDSAFRDHTAVLTEMSRREDWVRIGKLVRRLTQICSTSLKEYRPVCEDIVALGSAELLRHRPDLLTPIIDEGVPIERRLQIVADAGSPNGELILRELEPSIAEKLADRNDLKKAWVLALRATGTDWCRDQLVDGSAHLGTDALVALAHLGDERALDLDRKESTSTTKQLALLLARPDLVEETPGFGHQRSFYVKPRSPRYAGSLPPPMDWPEGRLDRMLDALLKHFESADSKRRLYLISTLRPEAEFWPNRFLDRLLVDDHGPVRLTALLYLLRYPRPEYKARLSRMKIDDPYPWCRRLAHEISIFRPDPLDPGRGVEFF